MSRRFPSGAKALLFIGWLMYGLKPVPFKNDFESGICVMSRLENSSLYQLTVTRLKLTLREPEAIFWIFVFPILLAIGLGIAFRNRPADVLPVGATTEQLTQALAAEAG